MKTKYVLLTITMVLAFVLGWVLLPPDTAETQTSIIYVREGASGDGSSWANAFGDLESALSAAGSPCEIWVSAGTYVPTAEYGCSGTRCRTFPMKNGVAVYGGFPASGSPGWEARDWEANCTVLSGDINGDDGPDFANRGDNCFHVVVSGTGVGSSAIWDGLTIIGGNADDDDSYWSYKTDVGGGIYIENGSPAIANCLIKDNIAWSGGGMYAGVTDYITASPSITDCQFISNKATRYGGAISKQDSSLIIEGCYFSDNNANDGGAIDIEHLDYNESLADISNCTFTSNSANSDGGGIRMGWNTNISECTFTSNTASRGGGISVTNWMGGGIEANMTSCDFIDNIASDDGGGIYADSSILTITECRFTGNTAVDGGGVWSWSNNVNNPTVIRNCIFKGNDGRAISSDGPFEIAYSTLYENIGGGIFCRLDHSPDCQMWVTPKIVNSIVWGGTPVEVAGSGSLSQLVSYSNIQGGYPGPGNISGTPLFFNPGSGDFHLLASSPCIDAGKNAAITLPEYDLDDEPRIKDGNGDGFYRVDMGVYEYSGTSGYTAPSEVWVDVDWTGFSPGDNMEGHTYWYDAFDRIQDGLLSVALSGTVHVNPGTYSENLKWDRNIRIIGAGPGNTIIDGTLLGCYLVHTQDLDNTALFEGFTLQNGLKGMYNLRSSPTIRNSVFKDNSDPKVEGGGIYNEQSSPLIDCCIFRDNDAPGGGGMGNTHIASPLVINSLFIGNNATGTENWNGGGAVSNISCSPIFTNCVFASNSAASYGGAVYTVRLYSWLAEPDFTNCTFYDNAAPNGNALAGVEWDDEYDSMTNPSNVTVTNSIIWNGGNEIWHNEGSTYTITNSDLDPSGSGTFTGINNINADPLFVNPGSNDFHLQYNSPCIDTGTNAAPNLPDTDFEGDPRILGIVDMGVDEVAMDVEIYVNLQGDGRPAPAGWEIPLNVGFYPPGSSNETLLNPGSAIYYYSQTGSYTVTMSGTRSVVVVGPVNPGTYDITVDSETTLLNVKKGVGIW